MAWFAVVAIALSIPAGSGAGPPSRTRPSPAKLREQTRALDARAHRALLDLYSIETRLGYARTRIAGLQRAAERVQAQEALARRQVAIARRALTVSRTQLGERLRLLYERGDSDPLAVLLGTESLEDAISVLDDLARANRQNQLAIQQTQATERSLAHELQILAGRGAELASLTAQVRATESSLARTHDRRASLLVSLRTHARLNRQRIAALEATARAAEAKSIELTTPEATLVAPAPPSVDSGSPTTASPPADPSSVSIPAAASDAPRTITVVATGYSLDGRTSTGLPVGWGIVAVDPAVIPLGTHITVPGYGDAVAADVGSGVRGTTIDLWFPTPEQALAWGRREITITLG